MITSITTQNQPSVRSQCPPCPQLLMSVALAVTSVATIAMAWKHDLTKTLTECGHIHGVKRALNSYSFFLLLAVLILLLYVIRKHCFDKQLNKLLFAASVAAAIAIFIMTGVAIVSLLCKASSTLVIVGIVFILMSAALVMIAAILMLIKRLSCNVQVSMNRHRVQQYHDEGIPMQWSQSPPDILGRPPSSYYIDPNVPDTQGRPSGTYYIDPNVPDTQGRPSGTYYIDPNVPDTQGRPSGTYYIDPNVPDTQGRPSGTYYIDPDRRSEGSGIYEEIDVS